MKRLFLSLVVCLLSGGVAAAANLTLGRAGRVTIELVASDATFHNTLSILSPPVAVSFNGCTFAPADGLAGTQVLSEKSSQHGCRAVLDADPVADGIQDFRAGTILEFGMCAQLNADSTCESVWSSNAASNSDHIEHVRTAAIRPLQFPGQIYQLSWEDTANGGDNDFNDLIANVRVSEDSDGDGLWDDWEQFGIDADGNGTIDLDLPALGANPLHKDIFLEIDWMDCAVAGGDCAFFLMHNHMPKAAAVAAVVSAFAGANVLNPDGINGITLHVDLSNAVAHQGALNIPGGCLPGGAGIGDFDAVKRANFSNARRFAFHYAMFTHAQGPAPQSASGCGELPGNDFQVSLGGWNVYAIPFNIDLDGDGLPDGNVGTVQQQAGTLMHELGHNLQLGHGGGDGVNYKPNYISIMNYRYQTSGIPTTDPDGPGGPMRAKIDYSRLEMPTLDEASLSEPAGIGGIGDQAFWACPFLGIVFNAPGTGPINWNCDGDSTDTGVSSDANRDGTTGTLASFWDWGNILYDFQVTGSFADGVRRSPFPMQQEMTYPEYLENVAPELVVTMSGPASSVTTGSNVTFTIVLKNTHSDGATGVVLTDTLPSSLTFLSCASTLGGTCGGTGSNRTVSFPQLAGGATATIQIVATLNCAIGNGSTIVNSASVASLTPDSDPTNNSASASITANNPPPVISNLSVDKTELWPPNHKMVEVTVSYNVTDNCDAGALVRTLSVTSNEPLNGTGDGDITPDWEIIDANHVRLRAERAGSGSGRIYTITITVSDTAGGASTATVTVGVPQSRK